jgi:putative transposase
LPSHPNEFSKPDGPELLSVAIMTWGKENDVEIRHIQPGKPNQNAFTERFNQTYREEVLSAYLFEDLDQVRQMTWEWLITYIEQLPYDALEGLPP